MNSILQEKQPLFYHSVIKSLKNDKKVQHAYLIETHSLPEVETYILEFVKQIFSLKFSSESCSLEKLDYLIHQGTYPDLKVLKPSSSLIKKEEILSLKKSLQEKPVYGNYQIYIIYEAEKLNSSSANTILKFLEEPEENIIAILVTENRYKVLETILSRCQILSFLPEQREENYSISEATLLFLEKLANRNNEDLFLSYREISEEIYFDKNESKQVLSELINIFTLILKNIYHLVENDQLEMVQKYIPFFEESEILKILIILDQKQRELQYNMNLKLWLDSLLLSLMEV